MSEAREVFRQVLKLHNKGLERRLIALWCEVEEGVVDEILASLDGLNDTQIRDLSILLSMTTQAQMEEWRSSVSDSDALYGATLLDIAAINLINHKTRNGPFPHAQVLIKHIKQK